MISVDYNFKFDGGKKYKSHNFPIYEKNKQNTYENFCKIAVENYLVDEPDSKIDGDLYDKMGIYQFNSEFLEDTVFKSVATQYKTLVKQYSDLMEIEFPQFARWWPDPEQGPIMAFANGEEMSKNHRFDYLSQEILNLLVPIINKNITNFYCVPWYTTLQRNHWHLTKDKPRDCDDGTAYQWHFDGVPKGAFKLFIYLTDVEEDNGPFTYMTNPLGEPVKMETGDWHHIPHDDKNSEQINPKRNNKTRIDRESIKNVTENLGYKPKKVVMPAGSFMVWNPNHIHRATYPEVGKRDVVQFHMRPTLFKPQSYWYGTNGRQNHVGYKHDWWLADHKLHNWGKE